MSSEAFIFGPLDVAEFVFYAFVLFFFGLVFYLRREDRREGYPLEEDTTGRIEAVDFPWLPDPKTYALPHGHGLVQTPNGKRETRPLALERTAVWPGAPLEPTGNPLVDGVGPAAYAERAKTPDVTLHGAPKIVPLRKAETFFIAKEDADPRGMSVIGADGKTAGVVADLWVDQSEYLFRYLEVELTPELGGRRVLMPMTMAVINAARRRVRAQSIAAAQFKDVPGLENPEQITLYEEERIVAYYGGGYLYALPSRKEPLL